MSCNSSTCIDRSGNLGLLLFCTLVHTIKPKKKGGREEREGTDERGKERWEWMTEGGKERNRREREGKEERKGKGVGEGGA